MKKYLDTINDEIREYLGILSDEFPEFLEDYIQTKEMQKQAGISVSCGTYYSKLWGNGWYSSLDHSVAVALVIWHFTKDKVQTLAGLLHDIATPAFKHAIDFMNGDYVLQESTEDLTTYFIQNSKEIMSLLDRDGITIDEVKDYHIYPIADNDTPQLSADRLEYTLSNTLIVWIKKSSISELKEIYDDIEIQKNENGIIELGFKHVKYAEKFTKYMSECSMAYRNMKVLYSMQFLADTMKKMSAKGLISKEDLYKYSETEILEKVQNSGDKQIVNACEIWKNAREVKFSDVELEDKYCVKVKSKVRYINPLVEENGKYVRIADISENAKLDIDAARNFDNNKYAYLDFNF